MTKPIFNYLLLSGLTLFTFSNFIACGAKMYQVSLADDHEARPSERSQTSGGNEAAALMGVHSAKGWLRLPVEYKFSKFLTPDQRAGISSAMKTWELAIGKTLFKIVGEDDRNGDSFKDLYSSLSDVVNGHYLDGNWAKTGKSNQVLATTIWDNSASDAQSIRTADIRFNSQYYIIGDSFLAKSTPEKEVVDMQTLALHELGHLLGLSHISVDDDSESIMNPSIFIGEGLSNRRLSEGDITRIQSVYGCAGESCDVNATFALINGPADGQNSSNGAPAH